MKPTLSAKFSFLLRPVRGQIRRGFSVIQGRGRSRWGLPLPRATQRMSLMVLEGRLLKSGSSLGSEEEHLIPSPCWMLALIGMSWLVDTLLVLPLPSCGPM